jgi:hypothetical protein
VFLNSMQDAWLVAILRGFRETGAVDGTFGTFNILMNSESLFLIVLLQGGTLTVGYLDCLAD